jgi:hypothetical protein
MLSTCRTYLLQLKQLNKEKIKNALFKTVYKTEYAMISFFGIIENIFISL